MKALGKGSNVLSMGMIASLAILFLLVTPTGAKAATLPDVLKQAQDGLAAGQSLEAVVGQALDVASASDIPFDALAAPLAETLLQQAIDLKQDGSAQAVSIANAMFLALSGRNLEAADLLRSVAQMIHGLCVAGSRNGLDLGLMTGQIQAALVSAAGSEELAQQLSTVIEGACQERAETYTPPPGHRGPPPPPPQTPPGVGGQYPPPGHHPASPSRP